LHASSPLAVVANKITISREFFFFFFFLILQKHYHKNLQFNLQEKIPPNFLIFFWLGFLFFCAGYLFERSCLPAGKLLRGRSSSTEVEIMATTAVMVSCNARMMLMSYGNSLFTPGALRSSSLVEAPVYSSGSLASGSTRVSMLGSVFKIRKNLITSIEHSRIQSGKNRLRNCIVRASLKGEGESRVRQQASEKAAAETAGGSDAAAAAPPPLRSSSSDADQVRLPADAAVYVDKSVLDSFLDVARAGRTADDDDLVREEDDHAEEEAGGIAVQQQELGRSAEADTAAVSLGNKPSEVAQEKEGSGPYFEDQELTASVLNVASDAAVDNQPEVDAEAERGAEAIVDKFGGSAGSSSKLLTQANIEELAEVAARLESQRASAGLETGSGRQAGAAERGGGAAKRRPSIEETGKKIAAEVRQRVEDLQGGVDGVMEAGEYAKEGLDKRIKVLNLAAEEARETGTQAADIAAKGWGALAKRTEDLVTHLQKTTTATQRSLNKNTEVAKEQIEQNVAEAYNKVGETRENINDLQSDLEQNLTEIQNKIKQKVGEAQATYSKLLEDAKLAVAAAEQKTSNADQSKEDEDEDSSSSSSSSSFTEAAGTVSKMISHSYEDEVGNEQLAEGLSRKELRNNIQQEESDAAARATNTDPVEIGRDDEWGGK
jgi:hypothetical protein